MGDLLIAPPAIPDHRFSECVLLITQESNMGTQALCLNKSSGHTVNEVIEPLGLELVKDLVLYWGGPVGLNTVWMLHSSEWAHENTQAINEHWSMTSNMQMFHEYLAGNRPRYCRFMIGHSAWAPAQLDMELQGEGPWSRDSSWLVAQSPSPKEMYSLGPSQLWHMSCGLAGNQAVSSWLA